MAKAQRRKTASKEPEAKRTRIFCVVNQKGGVGKTTTTFNLAAALREMGRDVLAIDLDPQGSLSTSMGLDADSLQHSMFHVLTSTIREDDAVPLRDILLMTESGVVLAAANIELAGAELELARATMGELVLREALQPMSGLFDYILIDCPPNLGLLTINALSACHEVIIPLQADYLAMKGMDLLMQTISMIKRKVNYNLIVGGVLITMADLRTLHNREVIESTKQALSNQVHVFEPIIHFNVRLKEAPVVGESILTYAKTSNVADAYRAVARELIQSEGLRLAPPPEVAALRKKDDVA
ncbi:ParA family protein [Myxococcota bacterium]|nr:ParA family protein [Myxococcota bacterium]